MIPPSFILFFLSLKRSLSVNKEHLCGRPPVNSRRFKCMVNGNGILLLLLFFNPKQFHLKPHLWRRVPVLMRSTVPSDHSV